MTRLISALVFALALALGGAVAPSATGAVHTGVIQGAVTVPAGGDPVNVGVYYFIENGTMVDGVMADVTGNYVLGNVADGTYLVAFMYMVGGLNVLDEYAGDTYSRQLAKRVVVANGATVHEDAALEAGAVLSVDLFDSQGPLQTAEIDLVGTGGSADFDLNELGFGTPAPGTFTSAPLAPGTYQVTAGGPLWVSETFDLVVGPGSDSGSTIVVAPKTTRSIDITLEQKGRVHGSASVATSTGNVPFQGNIHLVDPTNPSRSWMIGANVGSFELVGVDEGTYKLYFEKSDAQLTKRTYWPGTLNVADAQDIVVSNGSDVNLGETILEAGGILWGNVLYGDGQGSGPFPASATVSMFKLGADDIYEFYLEGQTGSTGRFDAGVVEAGTYAIRARANDSTAGLGPEWHTDARYFADRVDVVVAPGGTVQFADIVLEPRYFDTWRTAGANRFATAIEISREIFPVDNGARARPPVVYLVNAYNYPDALAAGPAAIAQGGSILPVARDFAPQEILDELADLDPVRIVVAGGVNAVSDAVLDQVRVAVPGADVDRIGETTRYETGRALVEDAFPAGSNAAFIATGRNYPDALAAGAAAGYVGGPVILVDGGAGGLDAATQALIGSLGLQDVFIAGGAAAVGSGVESALVGLLGADHVHRLAGNDRFETAAAINAEIFADRSEIGFVASGYSFPDALAGGPLAGAYGAPLYLAPSWCMPDPTFYGLWDGQAQGIWLLGGEAVLSPDVEALAAC